MTLDTERKVISESERSLKQLFFMQNFCLTDSDLLFYNIFRFQVTFLRLTSQFFHSEIIFIAKIKGIVNDGVSKPV